MQASFGHFWVNHRQSLCSLSEEKNETRIVQMYEEKSQMLKSRGHLTKSRGQLTKSRGQQIKSSVKKTSIISQVEVRLDVLDLIDRSLLCQNWRLYLSSKRQSTIHFCQQSFKSLTNIFIHINGWRFQCQSFKVDHRQRCKVLCHCFLTETIWAYFHLTLWPYWHFSACPWRNEKAEGNDEDWDTRLSSLLSYLT